MSTRLPQPGSDDGTWGTILNDFLSVVHNADGTLKSDIITDATISATAAIARTKLDASTQTSLSKADTALQSAPITSVNSQTGAVNLTASDVGADTSGAAAAVQAASLQIANNLSDLNSASTARINLELGGAATLDVGTTTGTVAAGDDSRFAAASTAIQSVNSKTGTSVTLVAGDIGAIKGIESTITPSSPTTNDLWYDSANDLWKRWNGSAWIISDSSNTYTAVGQIRVGTGSGQSKLLPKAGAGTFLRVGGADSSGLEWGVFTSSDSVTVIDNLMTAAGQLIVGAGNGSSEIISPGSDGQVLMADSTQAAGVAWQVPPGSLLATSTSGTLTVGATSSSTATGASITFIAPTSGNVLTRVSAIVEGNNNGGGGTTWTLSWVNQTGGAGLGSGQVFAFNSGSTTMNVGSGVSMASIITGLTAGQSYTLDLYGQWSTAQGPTTASGATLESWAA